MKKFTISAAALIAVAAFVTIPAQAEQNFGPLQQNGQCWKDGPGPSMKFGHWEACAQKASATTTTAVKHHKHPAASR